MPGPYGVTPTGFNRKRTDEVLADINLGVQGVFGITVDLDPESPDGQFNGLFSDELGYMWELAEDVYHSFDPFQAEGLRLDAVMQALGYGLRQTNELDPAFRSRIFGTPLDLTVQDTQVGSPPVFASNLRDDLEVKLSQVAGVTFVEVISNNTDITDPITTLPSHSYSAIVQGGLDADIAAVIWQSHPTGITMYGDTQVEIVDSSGRCRTVNFERPTVVSILIAYTVRVFRSKCGCRIPVPADIKTIAIDKLANPSCPSTSGETILVSAIESAISSEPGIEVCSTLISKSPNPVADANVVLAWNELPGWDEANISVVIVGVCP